MGKVEVSGSGASALMCAAWRNPKYPTVPDALCGTPGEPGPGGVFEAASAPAYNLAADLVGFLDEMDAALKKRDLAWLRKHIALPLRVELMWTEGNAPATLPFIQLKSAEAALAKGYLLGRTTAIANPPIEDPKRVAARGELKEGEACGGDLDFDWSRGPSAVRCDPGSPDEVTLTLTALACSSADGSFQHADQWKLRRVEGLWKLTEKRSRPVRP
jgi:hypothetical protein